MKPKMIAFLEEVYPGLLNFNHAWFNEAHDRDGDGAEWDHPCKPAPKIIRSMPTGIPGHKARHTTAESPDHAPSFTGNVAR
jgi:hypothetical protein